MKARPDIIDSIEGYYVASILDCLHREGVLRGLADGRSVSSIARSCGFDRSMLISLLEYLALRSSLIRRVSRNGRPEFAIANSARNRPFAHLLDQYVGAFGACLLELPRIMRSPSRGKQLVDSKRHAAAFSSARPAPELLNLIEALGIRTLLDIGCGGGQLLTELAQRQMRFHGIGIDANPEMVKSARRRMSARGVAGRLKVWRADFHDIGRVMTGRERAMIDGICAVSAANSFFQPDQSRDIDYFFSKLKSLFPNRILVLCDYCGRLGVARKHGERFKRTLVHDVAQLVSAQGIPPKDLRAWRKIYVRNAVQLLQAYTATDDGVSWFIHVVRL